MVFIFFFFSSWWFQKQRHHPFFFMATIHLLSLRPTCGTLQYSLFPPRTQRNHTGTDTPTCVTFLPFFSHLKKHDETQQSSFGLFVVKAATCVVFGTHDEHIQGGNCNTCVGNLADYLMNSGM